MRSAELGAGRSLAVLVLTSALGGLSSSAYIYQIRFYGLGMGIGYGEQSIYEAVSYVLLSLAVMASGIFYDIGSRRLPVMLSYAVAASSAAAAILGNRLGFAASVILFNTSFSLTIVSRNVLTMDLARGSAGRWFGYIALAGSLSTIAGPAAGLAIVEAAGYRGLFALLAIFWILCSALALLVQPGRGSPGGGGLLESAGQLPRILRSLWPFALYGVLDRFSYNLWYPLLAAFLAEKGFSSGEVALLYIEQNISWFLGSYIFGVLSERAALKILALSEVLTAAAAALLSLDPSPSSLAPHAAAAALGLSIASWIPSYNTAAAALLGPRGRGGVYSALYVISTTASAPSPYLGGLLRSGAGDLAHLHAASALPILNTVLLLTLVRRACGEASGFGTPRRHKA